jgi:hypothetical protein
MAGKNKILRWTRLLLGGYNLSGDSRTFSSLDNSIEEVDITGWDEAVRHFLPNDRRTLGVRGYQALMNDAAGRAFAVLKDSPNNHVLSFLFGGGAEPAVADPAYLLPAIQMNDTGGLDSQAPVIQADFAADAGQMDANTINPMGIVLCPLTALSATTNGAAVDNDAGSTAGAHANLHLTASSGGEWEFKVQHSGNGSDWADLMTFTSDGSGIAGERGSAAGTVDRYTRFQATRTSGTVTAACTFARN